MQKQKSAQCKPGHRPAWKQEPREAGIRSCTNDEENVDKCGGRRRDSQGVPLLNPGQRDHNPPSGARAYPSR